MRKRLAKLVCWFIGHRMYRVVRGNETAIAALLEVSECQRCGHWECKPKSVLLGIERSSYTWWRNQP